MDRAEQIGLGSAIGGHAVLLGLFAFGVFQMTEEIKPPEPITVSLVSSDAISDVAESAAQAQATLSPEELAVSDPAPVVDNSEAEAEAAAQQRAAAASAEAAQERAEQAEAQAAAQQKQAEAAAAAQAAAKARADSARVSATAAEKQRAREAIARAEQAKRDAATAAERQRRQAADAAQKAAARKAAALAAQKKAAADAAKRAADAKVRAAADAKAKAAAAARAKAEAAAEAERQRRIAEAVRNAGNEGSGKSTTEVRSAASASIAAQVRPLIPGCAPSTSENSSLRVFVALSIDSSSKLVSARIYDVQGIDPSNQAQVEPMKRCVLASLRQASPYNLDPRDFAVWKNHKVQLKVNFK